MALRALSVMALLGWVMVSTVFAQVPPAALKGAVVDVSGLSVPGVEVTGRTAQGQTVVVITDADGRFAFEVAVVSVTAVAEGFAPTVLDSPEEGARLVLRPAGIADMVVVTATRGAERLPSAASATVVTSAELANIAAGALDDVLRSTPGFSLFRRSSSRVANPTTQGVTLRGVSGSGASRTLVLADGIPLNDPFGSWVYWNRVPQASVDRVEVVRGAAGDLYGANALAGVIQVITFEPTRSRARATLEGGSLNTVRGSFFGGLERQGWAASTAYEANRTDGAFVVGSEARGAVDTRADSDYQSGVVTAGRQGNGWNVWLKGALYSEDRGNGTPAQVNDTDWQQVSLTSSGNLAGGAWQAQAASSRQDYYQTFTAVTATRTSERLTTEQTTDTDFRGVGVQWTRAVGRTSVVAGADAQRTASTVEEFRYSTTNVRSGPFFAGGVQKGLGGYVRTSTLLADSLTLDLGARLDWWASTPNDAALPDKSVVFASPRAALAYKVGRYALQGAAYRAYRPPTLNELHRGFRVGNTVTNPNPLLDPETLTGVEGGALGTWRWGSARITGFANLLDGAVANITLSSTSTQITRERRNSDAIRALGVEMEADARLTQTLSVNGQLVLTSSHFRGSVATPAIEGNRVPQVPAVQGGLGLTWAEPRVATLAVQARFSGRQFDDDLNAFELNRFGVADAQISRAVLHGVVGFLSVENMFNADYDAGRTPIRLIGWPRTVRIGLRLAVR